MRAGRKFTGLLICLVALVACAYFQLDVSMGVIGLYGLYVGSNVTQKIGTSYTDALAGRFEHERTETNIGGGK